MLNIILKIFFFIVKEIKKLIKIDDIDMVDFKYNWCLIILEMIDGIYKIIYKIVVVWFMEEINEFCDVYDDIF